MQQWIEIQVICAASDDLINAVTTERIEIKHIVYVDPVTIKLKIPPNAESIFKRLIVRYGGTYTITKMNTIRVHTKPLLKCWFTVLLVALLLFLTAFLPTKILFIRVYGAQGHDMFRILDAAAACGLRWGAPAREVRSEEIKNALLVECPEFTWAGVNIKGCVAEISVTPREAQQENMSVVADSICASYGGRIRQIVVLKGKATCVVGDQVEPGQQLVSGYEECGQIMRFVGADAEVYAETERQLSVITPAKWYVQGNKSTAKTKYSIIIGKKLIKLYNSCGISMVSCDRISKRYPLTLPGGFELPICVLQERIVDHEIAEYHSKEPADYSWIANAVNNHLANAGMLGYIESVHHEELSVTDVASFYGEYSCMEMISQKREAFILNDE